MQRGEGRERERRGKYLAFFEPEQRQVQTLLHFPILSQRVGYGAAHGTIERHLATRSVWTVKFSRGWRVITNTSPGKVLFITNGKTKKNVGKMPCCPFLSRGDMGGYGEMKNRMACGVLVG
jgi:hypothetical protein